MAGEAGTLVSAVREGSAPPEGFCTDPTGLAGCPSAAGGEAATASFFVQPDCASSARCSSVNCPSISAAGGPVVEGATGVLPASRSLTAFFEVTACKAGSVSFVQLRMSCKLGVTVEAVMQAQSPEYP